MKHKHEIILAGKTYNKIPYIIKCNTYFSGEDRVCYIEKFQNKLDKGEDVIYSIVKTQCYEFHMNFRAVSKIAWIEKGVNSLIIYQIFDFKDICNGYDLHYKELWSIIKENKDFIKAFANNNEWFINIRPNMFETLDELIKNKIEEADSK